jgi:hypothetical protein
MSCLALIRLGVAVGGGIISLVAYQSAVRKDTAIADCELPSGFAAEPIYGYGQEYVASKITGTISGINLSLQSALHYKGAL